MFYLILLNLIYKLGIFFLYITISILLIAGCLFFYLVAEMKYLFYRNKIIRHQLKEEEIKLIELTKISIQVQNKSITLIQELNDLTSRASILSQSPSDKK